MNQKLLVVSAFSANDAPLCERQMDFIHRLNGKRQTGHVLLVANADVHKEMRDRIRITAELAFESVTETIAPPVAKEFAHHKVRQMNNLFRHAALTAQAHFRWPWFWLEPDCAPVKADWIERLASAYDSQPKKYLGLVSGEKPFMARCGVYYAAAFYELEKLCLTDVPFPVATADKVAPSATKSDLIQYLKIESVEDLAKISEKAVVVHGDKAGIFAENWVAPLPSKELETPWISPESRKQIEKMTGMALMDPMQRQEIATPERIYISTQEFLDQLPPQPKLVELTNETASLLNGSMQPQEIAKEIKKFFESSGGNATEFVPPSESVKTDLGITDPNDAQKKLLKLLDDNQSGHTKRQTRRSKAEALDKKHRLESVATNGAKSSTTVTTP